MSHVQWSMVSAGEPVTQAVRAAVATTDLEQVNQHFGSATLFAVFLVSASDYQLERVIHFDATSQDGQESKLQAKFTALTDCQVVFSEAIGGSAVRQLMARGIQPIKAEKQARVADILDWLKTAIADRSQPWLNKSIDRIDDAANTDRFGKMEEEGWQE